MNRSIQTYDIWERRWIRLLTGFTLVGFGFACYWVMSQQSDARSDGWWLVYLLAAAAIVPGVLILLLQRRVVMDPAERRLSRVIFLLHVPILRRFRAFSELSRVEVRHEAYGDGGYGCLVGLVPAAGAVIWLRWFNAPETGPSDEALAFAEELAETTGLQYEIRR